MSDEVRTQILGVIMVVLGLIGLYTNISYSGWVLLVGIIMVL